VTYAPDLTVDGCEHRSIGRQDGLAEADQCLQTTLGPDHD